MEICHYTSIETLALILKYRTIRFNRLDRVDDIEESSLGYGQLYSKLGYYQFVSCWSKDLDENISLWKMYSNFKGVRISLDEDMFISYDDGFNEETKSYFPDYMKIIDNYVIYNFNNYIKLYDVIYVQNLEEKLKTLANTTEIKYGQFDISYNDKDIGIYKRENWAFQKECRFKIGVLPINGNIPKVNEFDSYRKIMNSIGTCILNNETIAKEYFDMPLHNNAFNNMKVVLAPFTSESEHIIVESLIQKFAPNENIEIRDSYFKDKIKMTNK